MTDPIPETIQARSLAEFKELLNVAQMLSTTPVEIKIDNARLKQWLVDAGFLPTPSADSKPGASDATIPKFATIQKFIVCRHEADEDNLTVRFHYDGLTLESLGVETATMNAIKATAFARDLIQRCMRSGS